MSEQNNGLSNSIGNIPPACLSRPTMYYGIDI